MLNALEAELVAALLDRRHLVHIALAYRAAVIRLLLLLLRLLQYRMAIYFLQPFESAPLLLNFEGARLPLRLFMSLTLLQHWCWYGKIFICYRVSLLDFNFFSGIEHSSLLQGKLVVWRVGWRVGTRDVIKLSLFRVDWSTCLIIIVWVTIKDHVYLRF